MSTDRQKKEQKSTSHRRNIPHTGNVTVRRSGDSQQNQSSQSSLVNEIKRLEQQTVDLTNSLRENNPIKTLLSEVDKWKKESLAHIKSKAEQGKKLLKQEIETSHQAINDSIENFTCEFNAKLKNKKYTKTDILQWKNLLDANEQELKRISEIKLRLADLSSVDVVIDTIKKQSKASEVDPSNEHRPMPSVLLEKTLLKQQYEHQNVVFSGNKFNLRKMKSLFEELRKLAPMDKYGPMSGDCDYQTTQMEKFLAKNFEFKNRSDEYIVHGVKSFRLGRPLQTLDPNMQIDFPRRTSDSFKMTVQEIVDWQRSYKVYADEDAIGISKTFLRRALQGLTKSGAEAFAMKFVVRISQCPILMEFDAHLIQRELKHDWPHRIKLVSVTGIDFAGRIHDINDITTYVANWPDVYEIDPRTGFPFVYNGRDFRIKAKAPRAQLLEQQLLADLMRMARLRLYACDKEGIQVVVETGIGLGVFAGRHIGIDARVRALSARAIRQVLEEDGAIFENIVAIVFALPIFANDLREGRRDDVYQAFVDEFDRSKYKGCVPVLIADQDMHRLTVWIAMSGYRVSELNPADSHGVFGEYWQNRDPAVEEKLALTTVGLLVQHHLINPHVLNMDHYHLVSVKTPTTLL